MKKGRPYGFASRLHGCLDWCMMVPNKMHDEVEQ
jgi:hypothetical protein